MQIQIPKPVKRHTQKQVQESILVPRPDRKSPDELLPIAYHEAGHAVLAWWEKIPIRKASIVADDETAGRVFYNHLRAKRSLDIACTTADRLKAERLVRFFLAGLGRVNTTHGLNDQCEVYEGDKHHIELVEPREDATEAFESAE